MLRACWIFLTHVHLGWQLLDGFWLRMNRGLQRTHPDSWPSSQENCCLSQKCLVQKDLDRLSFRNMAYNRITERTVDPLSSLSSCLSEQSHGAGESEPYSYGYILKNHHGEMILNETNNTNAGEWNPPH